MRLGKAICIAGLIGLSAAGMALANDVTFTANGTFNDGASLGGTLVIDTGKGFIESNGLDLTVVGGQAGSPGLVFDIINFQSSFFDGTDNLYEIDASSSSNPSPSLQLEFDIGTNTNLVGFTGATLCYVPANFPVGFPAGDNCNSDFSNYQLFSECQCTAELPGDPQLTGGSLAPSAAPEPKSFLLLAGPAVWLMFRQRRKAAVIKVR